MENWILSWGATILVTCGLAAYYTSTGKSNLQNVPRKAAEPSGALQTASPPKRKQPKSALRKESSTPASANGKVSLGDKTSASKTHQKSASVSFSTNTAPGAEEDEEEEADQLDANWALRLDANKKGVSLASTKTNKPKKQSKKKQTTSSAGEPAHLADDMARTAGGVSDMLEATPAAPSAIRIVGEEKPKKVSQPKAAPEKESKKQRQNRKKQEEAKAQREIDEQVRLKLLEQQRRTAREARGEPAKNGSASFDAKSNAWASSGRRSDGDNVPATTLPLLDTFEPTSAIPSEASAPKPSAALLSEQTSEWNEVPKGKKGKKKATGAGAKLDEAVESSAKDSASLAETGAPNNLPVPKPSKFASISTKELISSNARANSSANGFAALEEATTLPSSARGHPQDSDWAA